MDYFSVVLQLIFSYILHKCTGQLEQFEQQVDSLFYCKHDSDCSSDSFCNSNGLSFDGKCRCKDGYIMVDRNRTYYECAKIATNMGESCNRDVECQINFGVHAVCSNVKICQCSEGTYYGDTRCYKRIPLGEICTSNYNCRLGDGRYGYCLKGRCTCDFKDHPSLDGERCVFSVYLGERCYQSESCTHTEAKCYDGICRCMAGYIESSNNSVCLAAAANIGDPCTENIQCSAYIAGSYCSNGLCSCKGGHHGYGNECVRDAKLGEACYKTKECILSPDLENSVNCFEGGCSCIHGIKDIDTNSCVPPPSGSHRVTVYYSAAINVILLHFTFGYYKLY